MVLYFLTLNIICKSYYLLLHSLSNHYPILLKEEQSHPDSTFLKACLFCCLDRLCFFKYAVCQPFPYPATSDLFYVWCDGRRENRREASSFPFSQWLVLSSYVSRYPIPGSVSAFLRLITLGTVCTQVPLSALIA